MRMSAMGQKRTLEGVAKGAVSPGAAGADGVDQAAGHRAGRTAAPSMSVSAPAYVGSTAAPEKSRTS